MKCVTCSNDIPQQDAKLAFICDTCLCILEEKYTEVDIKSDTKVAISHKAKQRNVVFK